MTAVGFDVGNVICGGRRSARRGEDTIFSAAYLRTPAVPGAFDGVSWAVDRFGAGNVFFVSKVRSQAVRTKTMRWLEHTGFWAATGARPAHLEFCVERSEKAQRAVELGLAAFVDDKPDVLVPMVTVPLRLCFDPSQRDLARVGGALPGLTVVRSWSEVVATLDTLPA
ncbi:MAG: hypothetical protein LC749_05515 [Actinobacteria bacterium]|nr:hypothetical protein [Actinomycetota bacterium]